MEVVMKDAHKEGS